MLPCVAATARCIGRNEVRLVGAEITCAGLQCREKRCFASWSDLPQREKAMPPSDLSMAPSTRRTLSHAVSSCRLTKRHCSRERPGTKESSSTRGSASCERLTGGIVARAVELEVHPRYHPSPRMQNHLGRVKAVWCAPKLRASKSSGKRQLLRGLSDCCNASMLCLDQTCYNLGRQSSTLSGGRHACSAALYAAMRVRGFVAWKPDHVRVWAPDPAL